MAWQAVLREMDHSVSVADSGRIYLVGQLGKYLPGSIWAVVVQMELALRAGIPRARSFAASLVLIGLSTTAAVWLAWRGCRRSRRHLHRFCGFSRGSPRSHLSAHCRPSSVGSWTSC